MLNTPKAILPCCVVISIRKTTKFSDSDSGLLLEDKLSLAWKRSMQYAEYDEVSAQNLFSEFLAKINPEINDLAGGWAKFEKEVSLPTGPAESFGSTALSAFER